MRNHIYVLQSIGYALLFSSILALTFYAAYFVTSNTAAQELLAQFGYVGVFVLAIVTGLNVILPIPAVTLTPVFIAAGLSLPFIVAALVLGTIAADAIGFWLGHFGTPYIKTNHPQSYAWFEELYTKKRWWLIPTICLYVAFIPLPNELFLLPLAVLGMPFRTLLIPLIIGNTINQTLLALGINYLFLWWL